MVALLTAVVAACARGSPDGGPVRCESRLEVPPGFEMTESFEEDFPDHVGVRLGLRDGRGRELHYFAGIPGEFGEGLPVAGSVAVVGPEQGQLAGGDEVWVLVWDTAGPCAAHAVLGNGFTRRQFLKTLEVAGVVPADR